MGMNLFDDADDIEDISKIETDKEFAKRYEHNKKREELQRFEELNKGEYIEDSEDEESEESEDENEHDIEKLFDALAKVKNKDPIIDQKDAKLFDSDDDDDENANTKKKKKKKKKKEKKPMYLKDVVAKSLMEDGAELDEEDGQGKGLRFRGKSYLEEQDELRKAVVEAAEGESDEDGDLLIEKKSAEEGEDEEDEGKKKVDEYFGEDEKLGESDVFLKKFFKNRLWKEEEEDKGRKPYSDDLDVDEDEEEIEKQEAYEKAINFRYEEGAGDRVLGHARFTEGSVRKKSNTRRLQRESKKERIAQAEFERKEELKHMKNLKKKEIEEKLEKIRAIAGLDKSDTCALNADDLEGDFDPEEYDRRMKETFDSNYDEKEDVDPGFGSGGEDLEKPDFDKEDELLGLSEDWDVCGSGDGFAAVREKMSRRKTEKKEDILVDSEDVEEEQPGESKRKRKRKIPLREKLALDKELEEYYKLDYEGTIGDLKTRFKYTAVPPQRFGLNSKVLLTMDEKELNQYVPLKKLAPYREEEWKLPNRKRQDLIIKSKTLVNGTDLKDKKFLKKHKQTGEGPSTPGTDSVEPEETEPNDPHGISRRNKRKRRQAELKLSQSRLLAYGRISSKSKNKKKHS